VAVKKKAAEQSIRFRVDGVTYAFFPGRLTGEIERELWRETDGLAVNSILKAVREGALFAAAALVWLARRQAGDTVKYATVETALYTSAHEGDLTIDILEGGDDEGPPAVAGS